MNKKMFVAIIVGGLGIILAIALWGMYRVNAFKPEITAVSETQKYKGFFVPSTDNIVVNLDREVPQILQKNVVVETTPKVETKITWTDNQSLTIQPIGDMKEATDYTFIIKYKDSVLTQKAITTSTLTETQIKQEVQNLQHDEAEIYEETKQLVEKYPFYTALPINKEKYSISYIFETKQFRIILGTKGLSNTEIEGLKKQALEDIKNIRGDVSKPEYYYFQIIK